MSEALPVTPKVFRETLKESRDGYFVEYHCAQPPYCAMLNLIFNERVGDHAFVRQKMQEEMSIWLKRYPVPVMIHSIDELENTIHFSSNYTASTLMGYFIPEDSTITQRWGLFLETELPAAQLTLTCLTCPPKLEGYNERAGSIMT